MNILLTGATGFIGTHLLPLLKSSNHNITAVVRAGAQLPLPCTLVEGDLCDHAVIDMLRTQSEGVETVIHLAATMPAHSVASENTEEMMHANIVSTRNLLTSLPRSLCHMILASSIDVYGSPHDLPIRESHPMLPATAYAQSKIETERLARIHCEERNIPLTILRFTHIYGPQEPAIKAIPLFVRKIAGGHAPVLYGDGSDRRDYLYVTDAADAIVCAIERVQHDIFNIASGVSVTLKEVAELLIELSGKSMTPHYAERRKQKVDIELDVSHARVSLKFSAATPLRLGLAQTYAWYLAQKQ